MGWTYELNRYNYTPKEYWLNEVLKESQVYVRDEYCREAKAYICYKFEDVNRDRLIKGSKEVYIDFYF